MNRRGRPRRVALLSLLPDHPGLLVDVGADHGHIAHASGAIATERMPNRAGRPDVAWVICDGLSAFRAVDTAIIAGMGAHTIAKILALGPTPTTALLHAQDDPPRLRRWLAANGWRIDAEALAPEAGRFAEVIRAVRGVEAATGPALDLGPRLLEGDDPHLEAHLEELEAWHRGIALQTRDRAPEKHAWATERVAFLSAVRADRWPAQ